MAKKYPALQVTDLNSFHKKPCLNYGDLHRVFKYLAPGKNGLVIKINEQPVFVLDEAAHYYVFIKNTEKFPHLTTVYLTAREILGDHLSEAEAEAAMEKLKFEETILKEV